MDTEVSQINEGVQLESQRRKIAHIFQTYFPATAFGGPIFSTKSIIDELLPCGLFEFQVLTTDAKKPKSRERLSPVDIHNFKPVYSVEYCRKLGKNQFSFGALIKLPGKIDWADIVHLTGSYGFLILPTILLCRFQNKQLIWSPRGGILATAKWDGSPRKALKHLSERLCRIALSKNSIIHATSRAEAEVMQSKFPQSRVSVIPNSVDLPERKSRRPAKSVTDVRICFLSRLHEKKGLELLIEAMSRLPSEFKLSIYGSGDVKYERFLHKLVEELNLQGRVHFCGQVDGAAKSEAFWGSDIFVLPTYSENFGIVVAEALAHSLPVITTDRTPWSEIEEFECGVVIKPEVEELSQAILVMHKSNMRLMSENARKLISERYSRGIIREKFLRLYSDVNL